MPSIHFSCDLVIFWCYEVGEILLASCDAIRVFLFIAVFSRTGMDVWACCKCKIFIGFVQCPLCAARLGHQQSSAARVLGSLQLNLSCVLRSLNAFFSINVIKFHFPFINLSRG